MVKRGKLGIKRPCKAPAHCLNARPSHGLGPHFAQRQLRKQLIAWADANGYSLHADGLIVRTTIDSRLRLSRPTVAVTARTASLRGIADNAWSARNGWNPKMNWCKHWCAKPRNTARR